MTMAKLRRKAATTPQGKPTPARRSRHSESVRPVDDVSCDLRIYGTSVRVERLGGRDNTEVVVTLDTRDTQIGGRRTIVIRQHVAGFDAQPREARIALIRQTLIECMRHEIDEHLKVNGIAIFNPHNPVARQLGVGTHF